MSVTTKFEVLFTFSTMKWKTQRIADNISNKIEIIFFWSKNKIEIIDFAIQRLGLFSEEGLLQQ